MKFKIAVTAVLITMIGTVSAVYAQITVSVDGPVRSIQQAVEMAEPGDHIRVLPGTYVENDIVITKRLTLEGVDYPVIDGNSEGFIMLIKADSVTVSGFSIRNTGQSYVNDYAAIMIEGVKDFIIENNRLENVFLASTWPKQREESFGIIRYPHLTKEKLPPATVFTCGV